MMLCTNDCMGAFFRVKYPTIEATQLDAVCVMLNLLAGLHLELDLPVTVSNYSPSMVWNTIANTDSNRPTSK